MSSYIDSRQGAPLICAGYIFSALQRLVSASLAVAAVRLIWPAVGHADVFPVGYLSWDVLIPGAPGSPGVNAFTIGNLTGDPLAGGNDLPPTFPILTSLTFKNSSLVLWSGGVSQTIELGDIGPGFFSPVNLEFPDTTLFSSAILSATLDNTSLQLDGGGGFTATSDAISAVLLPSAGNSLEAGTDFTLIQVSPEVSGVPEPLSLLLLATSILLLWPYRSKLSR